MKIKTKNKTTMIFFIVIVVFCIVGFVWQKYFWFDLQYEPYITQYCNEYNVSKSLVYSIIKAESNFDTKSTSNKGAVGLMQIMPSTATFVANQVGLQNFDLTNPKDNITLGVAYLSYLDKKFDNQKEVICAYNAGETKVKEWIKTDGKIPYPETKTYLKRVTLNQKIYNALYK